MASSNPRVTVAICTRNRARYLEQALPSVLSQVDDQSEVLVIDNASTDDTATVVEKLSQTHSRLRRHREEKLGIANARNAALREGKGEWVLFFDDDQIAPPGWLQAYLNFFTRHPTGVGAVGGGCEPKFDVEPPSWFNVERARYYMGEEDESLAGKRTPGSGNCAYHRATALQLGGFCTELARAEDTDLNLRLQKAGHEVWWLARAPIIHLTPVSRTTLRSLLRGAFIEGRAYGRLRLRHHQNASSRAFYRIGRILFSPFHGLFLLCLAIITAPLKGGQIAARSLQRAARTLGIGWQLLLD